MILEVHFFLLVNASNLVNIVWRQDVNAEPGGNLSLVVLVLIRTLGWSWAAIKCHSSLFPLFIAFSFAVHLSCEMELVWSSDISQSELVSTTEDDHQ